MGSRDHASFFSGAGGLDLGLERAGWRTVSFSEIDPYASAVLAQRWSGVPNLGDITVLAENDARTPRRADLSDLDGRGGDQRVRTLLDERAGSAGSSVRLRGDGWPDPEWDATRPPVPPAGMRQAGSLGAGDAAREPSPREWMGGPERQEGDVSEGAPVRGGLPAMSSLPQGTERPLLGEASQPWMTATLWTAGFPCQDLSVAGKRRGFRGERSSLAFAWLDLVGRHRPRFVLLENVPGLLSSHGGKDFGTLLAAMVELGYGVGYRVLDARYFGVPQRRRRVFILGDSLGGRAGAERAAEVLSVGSRCHRHPPAGIEAGPGAAERAPRRPDLVGSLDTSLGHHGGAWGDQAVDAGHVRVSASPDSRGVRAPDGLAGRLDDRGGVAATLNSGGNDGGFRTEPGEHVVAYTKSHNVDGNDNAETWVTGREARSMNGFDGNRTSLVLGSKPDDDPLLPLGLDSHRYRCCGNGVVADVGEWIGRRLIEVMEAA